MATEKQAYNRLREKIKQTGRAFMVQRIENVVGTGVPDNFWRTYQLEGWCETKVGLINKAKQTVRVPRHKLRTEQRAWLERYTHLGGRAYIHLFVEDGVSYFGGPPYKHHLLQYLPSSELYDTLGDGVSFKWLLTHRHAIWRAFWDDPGVDTLGKSDGPRERIRVDG